MLLLSSRCIIAVGGGWVARVGSVTASRALAHDLVVAGDVTGGALVAPMSLCFLVRGARRDGSRGTTIALTYYACLLLLLGLTGASADVIEVVRGVRLGL